jgi:pyruvate,water dikinase
MKGKNLNKNIFYCEDFDKSWAKEELVGRKGLSLLKLRDMDVPVPDFFVISPRVFREVSTRGLERVSQKLLEGGRNPEEDEIENALFKTEFPREVEDSLLSAYTRISGFADAWVSVRSSIVFTENPEVSFSGVFGTELNVRGFSELKDAIRRVYASFFTDDAVIYASKHGIDLNNAKLAVVVQKMVQAEVSGSAFTVDPITQDKGKLSIEAVFGLGEVIASGEITPDLYMLNKRDLKLIEKTISPQEWMKVRLLGPWNRGKKNVEKVKISKSWSYRPKLNERELEEISKIALIVEDKSREHQNIEWVLSGGRVWILQNKPLYEAGVNTKVRVMGNGVEKETLRDVVQGFVSTNKEIEKLEGKAVSRAKKMVVKEKAKETPTPLPQETLLATGVGGSFGGISGKILILEKGKNVNITKRDILLIKSYSKDLESEVVKAGGVIMETGGLTSDIAILCREFKIPAVFGAHGILEKVKEGDLVKVDGNSGAIYVASEGEVAQNVVENEEAHPVVRAYEEGEVKKEEKKIEKEIKKEEKEEVKEEKDELNIPKDTTLPPCATKVYVSAEEDPKDMVKYVGDSSGIVCIDLDQLMIKEGRHILAFVEDKNFVEYANDLADKICEYVDLAQGEKVILSIGSAKVEEFRELTKGSHCEGDSLSPETYGLTHYLENQDLLKYVLKIVRRVRNVKKKRNVSLAVHSPMNPQMMVEFKKLVSSEGLKRTSTFEIFAIVDSPAEVILADEILGINIDGVIVNSPWIAKQMQGYPAHHKRAKYELGVNSVFKMVDNVTNDCRKEDKKCIVVVEDSKDLIKHVIESGVYGIVVNGEDIKDVRKLVAEQEAKLIMNL